MSYHYIPFSLFFKKNVFLECGKWFEECFKEKLNSKQFIKTREQVKLSGIFNNMRHNLKKNEPEMVYP